MSTGQTFISFPASKSLKKRVKKMAHRLELSQAEYIRSLVEKDLLAREPRLYIKKEVVHGVAPSPENNKIEPLDVSIKETAHIKDNEIVIDKDYFND